MENPELSEKFAAQVKQFAENPEVSEKIHAQAKLSNDGAPIPPVSASDMKQMWDATRRMNADMPPRPNGATGVAVFAAYGVDAAFNRPEEFFLPSWRYQILVALVERGVLNDYKHGEELDEKVFRAAATMPCDKTDLAETMLPLLFADSGRACSKSKRGHAGAWV
jgi:hypothetical protein